MNKEIAFNAINKSLHKDRIDLVIADSHEYALNVPDESLDVVFLDKSFSTDGQALDIQTWYSKVKIGGIFCGHDAWTKQIWDGVIEGLRLVGVKTLPSVIDDEVWYMIKV